MIVSSLVIIATSALAARAAIASLEGTASTIEAYCNKYEVFQSKISYCGESYLITDSFDMQSFYEGDSEIDLFISLALNGFQELEKDIQDVIKISFVEALRAWSRRGEDIFNGWVKTLGLSPEQVEELRPIFKRRKMQKFYSMAIVMDNSKV